MCARRLESLVEIEAALWRELERAVADKDHAWRVAVLATHDGNRADARSVVLREVDATGRGLLFFTDSRSAKAHQIAAHPEGTLVLWSPALSWQLRLAVVLELETAGLAVSSRWARLKMTPAAQDYLSPLPPGSLLADGRRLLPQRATREHFAVASARIVSMDWLELHAEGQRRAIFDAAGPRWVAP